MKKIVIYLILGFFSILHAHSQDSFIKHRLNFKLSHAKNPVDEKPIFDSFDIGNFRLEGSYGILNYLEVGGYVGYGLWTFETNTTHIVDYSTLELKYGSFSESNTMFYGMNANLQLLPIFIKQDDFRFDLYISGKYGWINVFAPDDSYFKGSHSDYAILGGLSFYLGKRFGLFVEYGYNKKFTPDVKASVFRYGLSLKFKK